MSNRRFGMSRQEFRDFFAGLSETQHQQRLASAKKS